MINDSDKMIMAKNIQRLMDINSKSRQDLCNALGFKYSTLSEWLQAKKYPRADKIAKLASYFNVSRSELVDPPLKNNINIGTNNGAVSGSGSATVINNTNISSDKYKQIMDALFGNSPEVEETFRHLKINHRGDIENIDTHDKVTIKVLAETMINAIMAAQSKKSKRIEVDI